MDSSSRRPKRGSPYDNTFIDHILQPRRIKIELGKSAKAYIHFGVPELQGNRYKHYTQDRGAVDSSVWLETDDTAFVYAVTRKYTTMEDAGLNEAEFASYAKETLLKRDPRASQMTQARRWQTERMLEFTAKPGRHTWLAPPLVGEDFTNLGPTITNYAFDLRPDCAYWLSLQAFDAGYMIQVQEWTFVAKRRVTCSYLTIEFKKDDFDEDSAINQVAAASALALYNRFLLRKASLKASGKAWTFKRTKALKHYGLTFTGAMYCIWCISTTPTEDFEWGGCRMDRVHLGSCALAPSVCDLVDWLNEIYCWGLNVYGPKCEKDLKTCIGEQSTGHRVSDIPADSEESSATSAISCGK